MLHIHVWFNLEKNIECTQGSVHTKNKLTTTTLSTKLISTSISHWLGNAGEDVIDENPFHNCVRPYFQCQQKVITADHEN